MCDSLFMASKVVFSVTIGYEVLIWACSFDYGGMMPYTMMMFMKN